MDSGQVQIYIMASGMEHLVSMLTQVINSKDNCGRRKKPDRRQFTYTFHIPERRKGDDRRTGDDRRQIDRNHDEAISSPM